jgi:hypothetical protein
MLTGCGSNSLDCYAYGFPERLSTTTDGVCGPRRSMCGLILDRCTNAKKPHNIIKGELAKSGPEKYKVIDVSFRAPISLEAGIADIAPERASPLRFADPAPHARTRQNLPGGPGQLRHDRLLPSVSERISAGSRPSLLVRRIKTGRLAGLHQCPCGQRIKRLGSKT